MLRRKNISPTRCIVITAMFSAIAVVLQLLDFPIPFLIPFFLEMDFSDLPALIAAFSLGPLPAVAVCFVKNFFHFITATVTGGVGELANFLLSSVFVITAGVVYYFVRNRRGAMMGSVCGAFAMGLFSIPVNYLITYPAYYKILPEDTILMLYQKILPSVDNIFEALVIFNFPFTLVKGLICTLITLVIYKHISPLIKGKGGAR